MNRQEITHNFISSLEKERIALGLTQAQMAEQLGISTSGYKKIVNGETTKIDLFTGYSFYHLTGKPILTLYDNKNPILELLQKFESLSPLQKKFISGLMDFEIEMQKTHSNIEDYVTLIEPTGDFEDGMLWDSANFSKIDISSYRASLGNKLTCAIKVSSNHLIPVYHSGDILLICQDPPRDGDTGVFINRESGRAYLRKFKQTNPCRLEPINNNGQTFYVDSYDPESMDKWIKFGYVLTKIR